MRLMRRSQVEFDKPSELLRRKDSVLFRMVEESGDKERLRAMAKDSEPTDL